LSAPAQPYSGALEAVDRVLNREPEADEVLRQTVDILHERLDRYSWVCIYFRESEELILGPSAGRRDEGSRELDISIVYEERPIGVLRVATHAPAGFDDDDERFLKRIALLVSAQCLVGWDTGGLPWSDAS
jgi:putative methionine-R-sulfoxide reductase with GAF domain